MRWKAVIAMGNKLFEKNCKIRHQVGTYQCVCADDEIAIFAPLDYYMKTVKYENMFAVLNDSSFTDCFIYKIIE